LGVERLLLEGERRTPVNREQASNIQLQKKLPHQINSFPKQKPSFLSFRR
jgi:hypothetical protein